MSGEPNNNSESYKDYLDECFNEYMNNLEKEKKPDRKPVEEHKEKQITTIKSSGSNNKKRINPPNRNGVGRKGLKWKLKKVFNKKVAIIALPLAAILTIIIIIVSVNASSVPVVQETTAATQPTTEAVSYQIPGVKVIFQADLLAGCEVYACTMLLQYLDYDIDEFEFSDNYLITAPISYGEDGTRFGPDMNSAFAGNIQTGYGINAPAMEKSMNSYLDTTNKNKKAYALSNEPLTDLCEEYIKNDIPVMVWATARMDEPYIEDYWVVDYVDENATAKIGDTVGWYEHEHCLLLVGYDDKNFYFCDSLVGEIVPYEKKISQQRYTELGGQAIVVK